MQFDDCPVSAENLLGEEGSGFRYAMAGLDGGRLNISACSLGAAQAAMNAALLYMSERKAFGKSLDQFQALQFRLADMEIQLQAARIYLRQAAWEAGPERAGRHKILRHGESLRDRDLRARRG